MNDIGSPGPQRTRLLQPICRTTEGTLAPGPGGLLGGRQVCVVSLSSCPSQWSWGLKGG